MSVESRFISFAELTLRISAGGGLVRLTPFLKLRADDLYLQPILMYSYVAINTKKIQIVQSTPTARPGEPWLWQEREQLRVECFIPTKMYYRPACWNAKEELTIFVFLVDTSQTEVVKSKSISDFQDLTICLWIAFWVLVWLL